MTELLCEDFEEFDFALEAMVRIVRFGQSRNSENKLILHREDGPAFLKFTLTGEKLSEHYYLFGRLHRVDGPAVNWRKDHPMFLNWCTQTFANGKYYLCGIPVKESDFKKPGFVDAFILEHS